MKPIVLLAFAFFVCMHSHAQQLQEPPTQYLNFTSVTIKDGLSQGMINYMMQDHFGFMWFATKDGLNRYDGYRFVVYRNDAQDTASLADNHLRALMEDSKGRIWIGTEGNGLDLFDRRTEKFMHFRHRDNDPNTISDDHIRYIVEDANGSIWISTDAGINRISFNGDGVYGNAIKITAVKLPQNTIQQNGFEGNEIAVLFADSKKIIWVFVNHNTYRINTTTTAFSIKPFNLAQSAPSNIPPAVCNVLSCTEDTIRGFLYFIGERFIFKINKRTNAIDVLDFTNYSRGVISMQSAVDANGLLWFTNLGRLVMVDFDNKLVKQIYYSHNGQMVETGFNVYKDRNNIIWIGTVGYGLLKHLPKTTRFHFISYPSISQMTEPVDDMLSIGGSEVKNQLFDCNQGKFIYRKTPLEDAMRQFQPITDYERGYVYYNNRNCLIVKNNLYWYDKGKSIGQPLKDLSDQYHLLNDSNCVWIGAKDSLLCLDEKLHQLKSYAYPVPPVSAPYSFCMMLVKDNTGNLWMASMKGVLCFNTNTKKWRQYTHKKNDPASLSSNVVLSICLDPINPQQYLWAGTEGGGLCKLDMQSGKIKSSYREKDGLPNSVIYGIVADANNNLWMSTNKGLSCFISVTNSFTNYDEADGLQSNEFNRYAFGKSKSGWLYFGGINGFNYFKPQDVMPDTVFSKVIFTDFKISNKTVSFEDKKSILQAPIYLTDKIELPYKDNMISIDFASTNFSIPSKNLYQYKLEGFDDNWISSGTNHAATYTNLDPGTYTFKVRASNNENVWSNDATSLLLTIIPPWYMTWWFRTAMVLVVAGGLYALYRYRLQQALKLHTVRNRIAADLHDEIGSTLSSISIFSEVINEQTKDNLPEVTPVVQRISESTQNMMEAMSDIVWTINPNNDRFENIINRMRSFAGQVLEAVNCKLHMQIDAKAEDMKLPMAARKNFYLIFKEAINNISKYSEASNVHVAIIVENNTVYLKVSDDGKGFTIKENAGGNGLVNMHKRATELHGNFVIKSAPEKGTVIEVSFPV